MYDRDQLREILSGQRRGLAPTLLRMLAAGGEPFYHAATAWRNWRYDRQGERAGRVGVPVISVGNITAGGTGKTPLVEWLARRLRARALRVTIISRGYGAEAGAVNDEALELEQKLPDVPHLQNPDRLAAAAIAVEELECQVILLDDAFQHRRIARDLDLVLIDASQPFGYGHLLPRGLLRESLAGLRRADAVILSRADSLDAAGREQIWQTIEKYAPRRSRIEATHAPRRLLAADGSQQPLTRLAEAPVAAFCGIGNPAAFRRTLERTGCRLVDFRAFPDHHNYTGDDIASLSEWLASLSEVELVVCTHKDLVKVALTKLGATPLAALEIGLSFLTGEQELEQLLEQAVRDAR